MAAGFVPSALRVRVNATWTPRPALSARHPPARFAHSRVRMGKEVDFPELQGEELRIGVVYTRWGEEMVQAMLKDCRTGLEEVKVKSENIVEVQVPGAFEAPFAARYMALTQKVDAVVVIGVLIKGETDHYNYIADSVASGIMQLQLQVGIPMIFGVLCCLNEEQAKERSTGAGSHAQDWGKTAVEMGLFRRSQIGAPQQKRVGFW